MLRNSYKSAVAKTKSSLNTCVHRGSHSITFYTWTSCAPSVFAENKEKTWTCDEWAEEASGRVCRRWKHVSTANRGETFIRAWLSPSHHSHRPVEAKAAPPEALGPWACKVTAATCLCTLHIMPNTCMISQSRQCYIIIWLTRSRNFHCVL